MQAVAPHVLLSPGRSLAQGHIKNELAELLPMNVSAHTHHMLLSLDGGAVGLSVNTQRTDGQLHIRCQILTTGAEAGACDGLALVLADVRGAALTVMTFDASGDVRSSIPFEDLGSGLCLRLQE